MLKWLFNNDIHGFPRKEVQKILNDSILWNNLLTYCLDKQLSLRIKNKDNPTPNSATLAETLDLLEAQPLFAFSGLTREELEKVKNLSRREYSIMLHGVTEAIIEERKG